VEHTTPRNVKYNDIIGHEGLLVSDITKGIMFSAFNENGACQFTVISHDDGKALGKWLIERSKRKRKNKK